MEATEQDDLSKKNLEEWTLDVNVMLYQKRALKIILSISFQICFVFFFKFVFYIFL